MSRPAAARLFALALVVSAASAPAATADTTIVAPAPPEARSFATTVGGWTSAVDYGNLVCIPGVTCPTANPSYRSTGGTGGAADGHLRATFGTLLGVLSTTTIAWTSPTFAAPEGTDEASLSFRVRPQIASLLAIGSVRLSPAIVDVADPSRSTALPPIPLTAASASFSSRDVAVPAGALVAGRDYRIRIGVSVTTNVSAVTSGNVDLDDVVLTLTDLSGPSGLIATAPASGPSRVTGSVDAAGLDTDIVVDYGTTTAYGATTTPVTVAGSTTGAQGFSVPLTGLTPGATYHYRVTATNTDGEARTADATFVAPSPPASPVPTVTGAPNDRSRTVAFDRDAGVTGAAVEVRDADGHLVDAVADDDADGTVAVVLPDLDGTYGVRVVRTNDAGLTSSSTDVPVALDREGPATSALELAVTPSRSSQATRDVSFVRPADATTVTAQVLDADDQPVGAAVVVVGTTAPVTLGVADGDYRVRLTLVDAAGNETQATSSVVTRDTVAPEPGPAPTVSGPGRVRERTVTFERAGDATEVTVEVLDGRSQVVDAVVVPSGASTTVTLPDADGQHRVRVRQTDAAGNTDVSDATTVVLDRVAPDLTALDAGLGPALSADRDRALTIVRPTDADVVTAQVIDADDVETGGRVIVAGSSATVRTGTADGAYRAVVRVTDDAGNTATRTTSAVTLDTTAPAAGPAPEVAGPALGRGRDVSFTRAADAHAVAIEVLDADGTVVDATPVATGAASPITLPDRDGDYRIRIRQTDAAGNADVSPATAVVLDRVAPEAGPAPEVTGEDTVRERLVRFVRAADAATVVVEVRDADKHLVGTVPVPAGASATVTLPDLDGDYRIRVRQTDAAGNDATTTGTTATLDRVAPEPGPTPGTSGDPDGLLVVFARAVDTVSAEIEVLDASDVVVLTVPVDGGDRATVRLPAAPGRYTLRVVQRDAAGNRSTTRTIAAERSAPATPAAPAVERPVADAAAPAAPASGAPAPCATPTLVLTRAATTGSRVRVSGWTASAAGTRVGLVDLRGRAVGSAAVGAGGTFTAAVPAPRTAKARRTAGWRAVVGGRRSHAVVLRTDNRLRSVTRTGTTTTLRGRVDVRRVGRVSRIEAFGGTGACPTTGSLLRAAAPATVDRRTGDYVLRITTPADGRVVVRVRVQGARAIHRSGYAVR